MRNFFSHRTREILWIILFAVLSSGATPYGLIVIPPEDVTGRVGETAGFKCVLKDSNEMAWTFNRKTIYAYLYGNEMYALGKERYSVTQDGRTFELSIKDLQYSDGGEYTCDVPSQVSAAHLIVIGPPHLFYSSTTRYQIENTMAKFVCTAKFGGQSEVGIPPGQYPKLQMFLDGMPLDDTFKEEHQEVATSSYKLTQIHYMTLKSNMDGESLMCKIKTIQPAVYETVMIRMNVSYSVRNIRYTPEGDEHKVGTTLNCNADGSPQPDFNWTDTINNANVIHGPSLRITEEMVGSNAWRCAATNTINGSKHEETLVVVFQAVLDKEDQTSPDLWTLPVGLIVWSGLVIGYLNASYVKHKIKKIAKRWRKKIEFEVKLEPTDGSELPLLDPEELSMGAGIDPRHKSNYHFKLNHVVLQVPPNSVKDRVKVTVTQRDTVRMLQEPIKSKGLDDVLKPVMQLSLQPFGLKLSQPAEIKMKQNNMRKGDYIVIFNKDDNDHWIDITNECNINITKNGMVFSVRRFSDIQILLCPSSSSTDPEKAANWASKVLNDKNVLQAEAKNRHTASYEEFMEIINGHNHGKDLDTATAKKMIKLLSDLKINFPIGGPAVTEEPMCQSTHHEH